MRFSTPRIVVAGLAGDSGKTLVCLGMARALVERGVDVAPFKKGPDYIDAAWLASAAGRTARNLDTFMMSNEALGEAVARSLPADLLLVEGNRGLFDGLDARGTHSTAELAKRLRSPALLVVDVTKMTRTAAALVLGCRVLDPRLELAGVILNRVATARQERLVREALAEVDAPPVIGAVPRLRQDDPLPGRHLGLVTAVEHPDRESAIDKAAELVRQHVDLEAVLGAAAGAGSLDLPRSQPTAPGPPVRVGVLRDEVFSFFYPENLEALERGGAELVPVSPRDDRPLPEDIDALYIGGGFPEVHVSRLAAARTFAESLNAAVASGLPVYAECGGLMLLARELIVDGVSYRMAGVLDLTVKHTRRPQGHGYVVGSVDRETYFFPVGSRLCGHEFHYSQIIGGADADKTAVQLERGTGVGAGRDGISRGRVWASYTHLHALAVPQWSRGLLDAARVYRHERSRVAVWS
ncbi:MAG: cobyrinate a,c-diamide synthase [Acidobacteria bacterium]|nr:cobyrinate a,c-diamide synthase [Acidobacteriota bacterium]